VATHLGEQARKLRTLLGAYRTSIDKVLSMRRLSL
jgi:hypothetical protein